MRYLVLAVVVIGFVAAVVGGTFNSQQCVPCIAVFVGLAAGYLNARLTQPETQALASRGGATVGAAGGLGALVGHVAGGLIGATRLGPNGVADLARSLGLDLPAGAASPAAFYQTTVGVAGCCGAVEILLMAGAGAVGGIIWYQQTRGQGQAPLPPACAGRGVQPAPVPRSASPRLAGSWTLWAGVERPYIVTHAPRWPLSKIASIARILATASDSGVGTGVSFSTACENRSPWIVYWSVDVEYDLVGLAVVLVPQPAAAGRAGR